MPSTTDRIQRQILLHAPIQRVWRALTNAEEFGSWFGLKLEGPLTPGTTVRATIVPTTIDADVASRQKQYEGTPFDILVERLEPERLFSFRWHPGAVEPGIDYSSEPTTLVTFELKVVRSGVNLTVTESGFDAIPIARRAKAFSGNAEGWAVVVKLIEKYLAQKA